MAAKSTDPATTGGEGLVAASATAVASRSTALGNGLVRRCVQPRNDASLATSSVARLASPSPLCDRGDRGFVDGRAFGLGLGRTGRRVRWVAPTVGFEVHHKGDSFLSWPPEARKRISDLWRALNSDPEMKELAAKSGFELINVGVDQMDAFMKDKTKLYTEGAKMLGLGKK